MSSVKVARMGLPQPFPRGWRPGGMPWDLEAAHLAGGEVGDDDDDLAADKALPGCTTSAMPERIWRVS